MQTKRSSRDMLVNYAATQQADPVALVALTTVPWQNAESEGGGTRVILKVDDISPSPPYRPYRK